jgi:hypothetical protein
MRGELNGCRPGVESNGRLAVVAHDPTTSLADAAGPGAPYGRAGLDTGNIAQAQRRDARAQISVNRIAGVHQHRPAW